jgi:uncharacterized protein YbjT (DUF2867 family)
MIALTTPNGNIGSKVLTRLLDANSPSVRLLARNPEKFRSWREIDLRSLKDRWTIRQRWHV